MNSEVQPSSKQAYVILILVILTIIGSLFFSLELVPALFFGSVVASLGGLAIGYSWANIEEGMIKGIKNGIGAILILMIIGMVIGTWILGGTIPTLITYGLHLLSPSVFLPAGFVLSSVVSLLIGSSFGTIATIGIVLMGVGEILGFSSAVTAGMVVSGAMFGDKISPLSDSTNLTSSITGAPLFSHVKSMLYVSGPAVLISLILYYLIGVRRDTSDISLEIVNEIDFALNQIFNISLWTLLPVIVIVVLLALKLPAIPALSISFLTAGVSALITQGVGLAEVIEVAATGYVSETGVEIIDGLLSQGGVNSMVGTIAMIIVGTAMGGILEETRILDTILSSMNSVIHNPRNLILTTLLSGYMMLVATGEMYVSIILPGRVFRQAYDEMGVNRNVLSRTLESSATLGCGILPWGIVSKYAMDVLGVGYDYILFAFVPLLVPIIVILLAIFNIGTFKSDYAQAHH